MSQRSQSPAVAILTLLVTGALVLLISGTLIRKRSAPHTLDDNSVTKSEFEGHTYLFFRGYSRMAAVHDPNCRCQDWWNHPEQNQEE